MTLESNNNQTNSTQLLSFLSVLVGDQMVGQCRQSGRQAGTSVAHQDKRVAVAADAGVYVYVCALGRFQFLWPTNANARIKALQQKQ